MTGDQAIQPASSKVDRGPDSQEDHMAAADRTQDLFANLSKLLSKLNAEQEEPGRLSRLLNSPFGITVVGGAIAAGITTSFQFASTRAENGRVRQERLLTDSRIALEKFATELSKSMSDARSLREREFWLKLDSGSGEYPDGSSRAQVAQAYEEFRRRYYEHGGFDALCSSVLAFFRAQRSRAAIEALDASLDRFMAAPNMNEMYELFRRADDDFQASLRTLGDELYERYQH